MIYRHRQTGEEYDVVDVTFGPDGIWIEAIDGSDGGYVSHATFTRDFRPLTEHEE